MTFNKLYLACGDMYEYSRFFVAICGSDSITTFSSWHEIPEEVKNAEVFGFSYHNGEWCIVLK